MSSEWHRDMMIAWKSHATSAAESSSRITRIIRCSVQPAASRCDDANACEAGLHVNGRGLSVRAARSASNASRTLSPDTEALASVRTLAVTAGWQAARVPHGRVEGRRTATATFLLWLRGILQPVLTVMFASTVSLWRKCSDVISIRTRPCITSTVALPTIVPKICSYARADTGKVSCIAARTAALATSFKKNYRTSTTVLAIRALLVRVAWGSVARARLPISDGG